MIIFQTIPINEFVKKQKEELRELWYSCKAEDHEFSNSYSMDVKSNNEDKLSVMLEWLGKQLERTGLTAEQRKNLSMEVSARGKALGRQILGFSDEQLNCFETLGIDKSLNEFFHQARAFDPTISEADIYQAGRNVWTGNYLQALLGLPVELTPSLFAYSMLYPLSDNYLDDPNRSRAEKAGFNQRFRTRLCGEKVAPLNKHEEKIFALVHMVEEQYPRRKFPQVYESLLAIHEAQDKSMHLPHAPVEPNSVDVVGISFEKGGTSVLADGFLAAGELSENQMKVIFNYGAFAQLMDDQEDVEKDLKDRSITLFTEAAQAGKADRTMQRVFSFAAKVLVGLDQFQNERVRPLKQASMKGIDLLLIDAALRTEKYYSRAYLKQLEEHFPFRFKYMKKVREKITKKKVTLSRLLGLFTDIPSMIEKQASAIKNGINEKPQALSNPATTD
jgi:hypothetical protein